MTDSLILVLLILLSGMFSGLTIGLFSLSKQDLQRDADLGSLDAKKVLDLIQDSNLLLVSLLLGNTLVNSTVSIFLGFVIGTGILAVTISTSVILLFGEILPAAIFTKHALLVGSKTSFFVKCLLKLFYPIAKPIAMVLDKILGQELNTFYNRKELVHIVNSHQKSEETDLDEQDGRLLKGVLTLHFKYVKDNMTQKDDIYSLDYKTLLEKHVLNDIRLKGYTRIPIIKDEEILGVLNSKELIGLEEINKKISVLEVMSNKILKSNHNDKIDDLLSIMIETHIHISSVFKNDKLIGIITMEDILEEIIQKEILDETDY